MKHLKLFEQKEEYTVLATNNSSTSWEYDHHEATAQILLDNNNSLYLKIRKVHTKSGLGAGTFGKDVEFENIGTLQKPILTNIRALLKKHQYDQRKFSRFWTDIEGNNIPLADLLKMLKPEVVKKERIHIKPIETFDKPKENIELVKYSDKSYAIFGEGTKAIKDDLSALGCRYNRFLTDPATGQKRPGWICQIGKIEKVKQLL